MTSPTKPRQARPRFAAACATLWLAVGLAFPGAQAAQVPAPPFYPQAILVTSGQTVTLPTGWHRVRWRLMGAAGGSGCGTVVTASTVAVSGGGTGASGSIFEGTILASQVANATSVSVTIGAGGTSCVPSGTTNGSSGSAPGAGGTTSFTLGGLTFTNAGSGAGSNGSTAASAGGATGGSSTGSSASGSTPGNSPGATGGINGSASGTNCAANLPLGCGGGGDPAGAVPGGSYGLLALESSAAGPAGSGLAAVNVALAGTQTTATFMAGPGDTRNAGGLATCTSGSQNGGNGVWGGIGFHGVPGNGGASCIAANGGNGGNASGVGSSGGGGGATVAGFLAGAGGTSTGGGLWLEAF